MRRRLMALALALVLALSLTGCWEDEAEPDDFWDGALPQEDETPAREPARISEFTLPYLTGQTLDPVTCIDGVQQTVGALLYEPLFYNPPAAEAETQLWLCLHAESSDYLTWVFSLRSDVTFSDGSPLTANDVLATYRRAAASERYGTRFAKVASMKARDTHTLVITLTRANCFFSRLLDIPVVKSGTENDLVPLGTGPYVYTGGTDGAALTVNERWWRDAALPLGRIALAAAKDNDTALSLFASRSVHFLCLDPTGTGARTVGGAVELHDVPTTTMQYLGFNLGRTPLGSAAVRRAMSGLIDREELVSSRLSGHGTAAQLPLLPQGSPPASQYEYTVSASDYAAALKEASVSDARPRSLTLLVNEESSFKRAVAESLCAQLSTAALTVTVRALPWEDYLAALQSGNFDLYLGEVRLTADGDASALLDADGALNYGGFVSEQLSARSDEFLRGENASAARYAEGFIAETPFAPLLFKSTAVLTPSGLIEGMTPTVSAPFYGFENWTFHLSDTES